MKKYKYVVVSGCSYSASDDNPSRPKNGKYMGYVHHMFSQENQEIKYLFQDHMVSFLLKILIERWFI